MDVETPDPRAQYSLMCDQVAQEAIRFGVTIDKSSDGQKHEIVVSGRGKSVTFPVVSDPATWLITSSAEAFYGILQDARSWSVAHVEHPEKVTEIDAEIRLSIRTDFSEEINRVELLTDILGGKSNINKLMANVKSNDI